MSFVEFKCHECNKSSEVSKELGRREECEHCGADIHSCLNCKFYDRGSYNECREVSADVVQEKDRANFCDYFLLGDAAGTAGSDQDNLLAAAEALFKK